MATQVNPQVDPQLVQQTLEELRARAEDARRQMLQRFAADQEEEVTAYKQRREELAKTLPPDDPLLAALDRRILGGTKLLDFYGPGEPGKGGSTLAGGWAVTGRVLDARSRPVSGARVTLQSKDTELQAIFGQTKTAKDGRFEARHSGQELKGVFARGAKARLAVTSATGKLTGASEDVVPEPGGTHTFTLRVAAAKTGTG